MTLIVLDTNVLVAALLNVHGVPARLWRLILAGHVRLCVDQQILVEYDEVLRRPKFGFRIDDVNSILAFIEDTAVKATPVPLPAASIDPDDQVFMEVALTAQAAYLVTGNLKHFSHVHQHGVRVVPPGKFMEKFIS